MSRTMDTRETDNRDLTEIERELRARIEAQTKRIRDLEEELAATAASIISWRVKFWMGR